MAYELIETIEVGAGGAASIEFTSIPQDGVDLVVLFSAKQGSTNAHLWMNITINGSGTGRTAIELQGQGSSASSASYAEWRFIYNPASPSGEGPVFSNTQLYFSNYASSASKSLSIDATSERNATGAYQQLFAASSTDTNAITSIQLNAEISDFVADSTASLYKIS